MTSPRPWRVNPDYPSEGHSEDPSPILDADGNWVIEPSEWLRVDRDDLNLIVAAVNVYQGDEVA